MGDRGGEGAPLGNLGLADAAAKVAALQARLEGTNDTAAGCGAACANAHIAAVVGNLEAPYDERTHSQAVRSRMGEGTSGEGNRDSITSRVSEASG